MAFKMKGSPMKRNFGVGSPMKHSIWAREHRHVDDSKPLMEQLREDDKLPKEVSSKSKSKSHTKMRGTPMKKHVPEHVAGQFLTKNADGSYSDKDTGKTYKDPKGIVTSKDGNVVDDDFTVNSKGEITGIYEYED